MNMSVVHTWCRKTEGGVCCCGLLVSSLLAGLGLHASCSHWHMDESADKKKEHRSTKSSDSPTVVSSNSSQPLPWSLAFSPNSSQYVHCILLRRCKSIDGYYVHYIYRLTRAGLGSCTAHPILFMWYQSAWSRRLWCACGKTKYWPYWFSNLTLTCGHDFPSSLAHIPAPVTLIHAPIWSTIFIWYMQEMNKTRGAFQNEVGILDTLSEQATAS